MTSTDARATAARWWPTHAHVRGISVAGAGVVGGIIVQRPELVLLVVPVLIVLVWSVATRPDRIPRARLVLSSPSLTEGAVGQATAIIEPVERAEFYVYTLPPSRWMTTYPRSAAAVSDVAGVDAGPGMELHLAIGVQPNRWGTREIGPAQVGGFDAWASFRWGPAALPRRRLRVLPAATQFDSSAPAPHPRGLVGAHRSTRAGDGSEFRAIRPFQWGDRLKRIHWARSLRSGGLHVTSSHADQDTHVAIIVDAHYDVGTSDGLGKAASSLDTTVRAAAAVAQHFLHDGDRVSLTVWSARSNLRISPGTGARHHRRIQEGLAAIEPGVQDDIDLRRLRRSLPPGSLAIIVSSLISQAALRTAANLSGAGVTVVVVDALTEDVGVPHQEDLLHDLAWRIRMIERAAEIRRIGRDGVPVVPWRGPGSLDVVLRNVIRRGR